MQTTRRSHRTTLVASAAALATLTLGAAPALANHPAGDSAGSSHATGKVRVNKGYTLSVHAGPSSGSPVVRKLHNHASVGIVCQTAGTTETGRFGTSNVWDKLVKGGYVTDTYVYTGSDGRVAPDCGGATTPPPSTTPGHGHHGHHGRPKSITLRNDYPFPNASWNDPDPWGFFYRECTSFVAFRLNKVMDFSNHMRGGHFGDAGGWDDNARALGYKVDTNPKPGSVMVRNSGTYGHVAMVAKVKGSQIFVEQYNAGGDHTYSSDWMSKAGMVFIHFKKGQ